MESYASWSNQCSCYLDDLNVHTKTIEEQFTVLGFVISGQGISVDPTKLEKLVNLPKPSNVSQLRTFLGLASYYRRFIHKFAHIADPLYKLLHNDSDLKWTQAHTDAFETLKKAITSPPVLSYPNPDKPYTIHVDASLSAYGAVLSQPDVQDVLHPVMFISKSLDSAERKRSATEREFGALYWAIKHFRHFVEGTKFTVVTDHQALLAMWKDPDVKYPYSNWVVKLQGMNFDLIHQAGKNHVVADAMSRLDLHTVDVSPQSSDPSDPYADIKAYISNGIAPSNFSEAQKKSFIQKCANFFFYKNHLYFKEGNKSPLFVVHPHEKAQILSSLHDDMGHFGRQALHDHISKRYYWPRYVKDVEIWVKSN